MKKTILSVLAVVALFAGTATPAFASMNFVGEGYKVPPACTTEDHGIYEFIGTSTVMTGCWTPTAWNNALTAAAKRTHSFSYLASVTLRDGRIETCQFYWGCVIDPDLVR